MGTLKQVGATLGYLIAELDPSNQALADRGGSKQRFHMSFFRPTRSRLLANVIEWKTH
jgi:hypothetical protein